ncbi:MAG: hypothetical protein EB034_21305, partial [Verrucomicrobia bacterium]|nr:hypothetical protein [Verrucomicrobiota bacterium]
AAHRKAGTASGTITMKHILPTTLLHIAFATFAALPFTVKSAEIKNDSVWKDDRGEEIMCQGGNLAKFGDTFYFYGWGDYPGDNRKDTITCYSSKDLATWKFERHVATYGKNGFNIIPDRLHVLFNEATRKYVMITKHRLPYRDPDIPDNPRTAGEIGFADCDTPTGDFVMRGHERPKSSSAEWYAYGDLCAFKDTDGKAYVVSAGTGQKCFFVLQLTPDYMHYEKMLCKIPGNHEAPYMVRMNGKYWIFASGVAGWSSSKTYFTTATNPAGPWSAYKEVTTEPESKDSFNSQSDFLFEVKGSTGSFVLWGADRWSQRTKIGVGKNVWLPLEWKGDEPILNWHPTWNVDAAAGTWTTSAKSPATTANEIKPWTIGTTNGRQHLVTPEGKPFLVLGLSHASGAWQGLLGPKKQEAMTALRQDLRDLKFNAVGYVPDLGAELAYIHNADRLPGSPGTVTGQGQRKHLYEDVFDPAFHARLRKHIQGIADKTAKDAHCIGYWWTDIPVWNPGQ